MKRKKEKGWKEKRRAVNREEEKKHKERKRKDGKEWKTILKRE